MNVMIIITDTISAAACMHGAAIIGLCQIFKFVHLLFKLFICTWTAYYIFNFISLLFKLMTPIIQIIQHTQQRNKTPINYIALKNGIKFSNFSSEITNFSTKNVVSTLTIIKIRFTARKMWVCSELLHMCNSMNYFHSAYYSNCKKGCLLFKKLFRNIWHRPSSACR